MFGKEQEQATTSTGGGGGDPRGTSILAQGCTFRGEVEIQGIFRVEGEFEGTIRTPEQLVVVKTGVVKGDIYVKTAVVGGRILGNIHAETKIELQSGSHVEGDIRTRRLVIDEGVFFEGNCSMGTNKQIATGEEKSAPSSTRSKEAKAS